MEQLSGLDASFLYNETATNFGHVGSVQIFAQPPSPAVRSPEELRGHIEHLYSLGPYMRRRLVEVPFGLDHPYWIEDPDFDPEYHERFIAVPAPGDDRALEQIVSRIASRPLDRSKPLWETYLIDGVDQGRKFALYSKTHHCAIDGASGTALALAIMQPTPEVVTFPMPERRWQPERVPTEGEMLVRGLVANAQRPLKLLSWQRRTAAQLWERMNPASGDAAIRERLPQLLNQVPATAPRTIFNRPISQHRRFAFGSTSLAEARTIKSAFGCTVNDVVLALCSSMLRNWLAERDELPSESLIAMVPVSVRTEEHKGSFGNQVSGMAAVLHTDEPDPRRRLERIHDSMNDQKALQQAMPVHAQLELLSHLPASLFLEATRLAFQTRLSDRAMPFNLTISNVPGPQFPLYMDGAEQLATYPYSMITDGMGLNITVTSYNGHLDWGIVVDRDIVADAWPMFDGIVAAQAELLDMATSMGARADDAAG